MTSSTNLVPSVWGRSLAIRISPYGSRSEVMRSQPAVLAPDEPTLRQALAAYLRRCRIKGRTETTTAKYSDVITRYGADWLDWPLSKLGRSRPEIADRHRLVTERHGPIAANEFVRTVCMVYSHATRFDPDLPASPTCAVDYNPEPARDEVIENWPAWWSHTARLLNEVSRDWYRFLAFTGMRRTAASQVAVKDIDLERGFVFVPNPKGGTTRAFHLPVSQPIRGIIAGRLAANAEQYPDSPWLFPSIWGSRGYLACTAVGMPAPHVHRHSYATAAKAAGLADYDLKLLLNHKIADVTGRYLHTSVLGDHLLGCQEQVSAWILAQIRKGHPGLDLSPSPDGGTP